MPEAKENNQSTASCVKNSKRSREKENKENQSPVKIQKKEEDNTQPSPLTRERKFLSPIRKSFVLEGRTARGKLGMDTPKIQKIIQENSPETYFNECITFRHRSVSQADFLFDPNAEVLSELGEWETNLKRMKRGQPPITYKGIISKDMRDSFSKDDILRKQKKHVIQIHHTIQRDPKPGEDPKQIRLWELSASGHSGIDDRLILKEDPLDPHKICIIASGLKKEEAYTLCSDEEWIITNTLHPRVGPSLIRRNDFDSWRKAYWIYRAHEIEAQIN